MGLVVYYPMSPGSPLDLQEINPVYRDSVVLTPAAVLSALAVMIAYGWLP
ncbi:hypothetical protein [Sphingomonas desiccabilis]|nr:hypothetical protein [Sphingomonas desiccabilis]MBB3912727.1 hypothetical protein [Sphingomonas desiccabilis]